MMRIIESFRRALSKSSANPRKSLQYIYDNIFLRYGLRVPATFYNTTGKSFGTNVFQCAWDLLVVLDTCRVDALVELAGEYDFLDPVCEISSVGAATPEWVAGTFIDSHCRKIRNTTYLTANAYVDKILGEQTQNVNLWRTRPTPYNLLSCFDTVHSTELNDYEKLWRFEQRSDDSPIDVPVSGSPRVVTDRAIYHGRNTEWERLICHYKQPHGPYTYHALDENRPLREYETDSSGYVERTGDFETVWNAYLDEVRYALDDIELLLKNIDASRVVITADHGNAFGEYGIWGHPIGSLNPFVRTVPWVTTSAVDTATYEPDTQRPDSVTGNQTSTDEQLEALGYKI